MSVLNDALKNTGLKLAGNNALPKEDRTVKSFQRLIAAVRTAEAEHFGKLRYVEGELNVTLKALTKCQEENHALSDEVKKYKLMGVVQEMESITQIDKQRLLTAT